MKDPTAKQAQLSGDEGLGLSSSNSFLNGDIITKSETPNLKKRHRRVKSSSIKNSDGYEGYIFNA